MQCPGARPAAGIVGPAGLDIIRSAADGKLYLIEINYRFGLSDGLAIFAGVDIPRLAAAIAKGEEPRAPPAARACQWVWLMADARPGRKAGIGAAAYIAWLIRGLATRRLMINEISLRDPGPTLQVVRKLASSLRGKLRSSQPAVAGG